MIIEAGYFTLILAVIVSFMQINFGFYSGYQQCSAYLHVAKKCTHVTAILISFSFLSLCYGFVYDYFSVIYIFQHSYSGLPWLFKICAVWGGHEGSLLLWLLLLTIWNLVVSFNLKDLPVAVAGYVLAVLAIIVLEISVFIVFYSSPFERSLPIYPQEGQDLNPLLQDPGLISHPPILYMGYVGLAVAFAFVMAILLYGRLERTWINWLKPWTHAAWCFLTVGIVLGSWWAYRELGWGGWWFWDPVENASLMPWLVATALIHALVYVSKRGTFKPMVCALAIAGFGLSLLGTFLVRSGILISVHSFAVDAAKGEFLLFILALNMFLAMLLYGYRFSTVRDSYKVSLYSRESTMMLGTIFLLVIAFTIFLGTLYPLVLELLTGRQISVGMPYFNSMFFPLGIAVLFLMIFAPYLRWTRGGFISGVARHVLTFSVLATIVTTIIISMLYSFSFSFVVLLFLALLLLYSVLFLSAIKALNSYGLTNMYTGNLNIAMVIAHAGVALVVLGIVFVTELEFSSEFRTNLASINDAADYNLTIENIAQTSSSNYSAVKAKVIVATKDNTTKYELFPEIRTYIANKMDLAKVAIHVGVFQDIYVALGQQYADGSWSVRFYTKPLVRYIWYGGLLMALGGCVALLRQVYYRKRY